MARPGEVTSGDFEVFDAEQRALLTAVLNRIIPGRDTLPGAGDLGAGQSIEQTLVTAFDLRRLFFDGLMEITLESARTSNVAFQDLDADLQDALLSHVEELRPAFFTALVDHTYRGYYVLRRVHEAIGWDGQPPQPRGHLLAPFDPALLAIQRKRPPFWRKTT